MSEPLPVRRTNKFNLDMKNLIQKSKRKNLIYNLEHISIEDLERYPNLKTSFLRPFRSYHYVTFRILFVYCNQCFNEFNHQLNCKECDENDLERIVLIDINHRSNAYRYNKSELKNFNLS